MKTKSTIKYVSLQSFFWMAHCVISGNFANIYLRDMGVNNTEIGVVLTGGVLFAVVLQLLLSSLCDRHDAKMPAYICVTSISLSVFIAIVTELLYGHKLIVMVLYICIIAFQYVIPIMMNTMALNIIKSGIKINYGLGRGAGSVAFAIVSVSLGKFTSVYGSGSMMYLFIGFNIFMLLSLISLWPSKYMKNITEQGNNEGVSEKSSFIDVFKKYRRYILFLSGIALIFICVAFINSYLVNICDELGADSSVVGTALAIAAVVELPAMAFYNKISAKISCVNVLRITTIAFIIKILILVFAVNITMVYISMFFQMFSYALYIPASVFYTERIMDKEDKTKGQALLSIAGGGLGMGGILGGMIIDNFGLNILLTSGAVITVIGAFLVNISLQQTEVRKT